MCLQAATCDCMWKCVWFGINHVTQPQEDCHSLPSIPAHTICPPALCPTQPVCHAPSCMHAAVADVLSVFWVIPWTFRCFLLSLSSIAGIKMTFCFRLPVSCLHLGLVLLKPHMCVWFLHSFQNGVKRNPRLAEWQLYPPMCERKLDEQRERLKRGQTNAEWVSVDYFSTSSLSDFLWQENSSEYVSSWQFLWVKGNMRPEETLTKDYSHVNCEKPFWNTWGAEERGSAASVDGVYVSVSGMSVRGEPAGPLSGFDLTRVPHETKYLDHLSPWSFTGTQFAAAVCS